MDEFVISFLKHTFSWRRWIQSVNKLYHGAVPMNVLIELEKSPEVCVSSFATRK